jgi:hypothetical protein
MEPAIAIISRSNALIVTRDYSSPSPFLVDLVTILLVLVVVGLASLGGLWMIKRIRKTRADKKATLPLHIGQASSKITGNRRRLTITTSRKGSSVYVYDEKASLTSSPPSSPMSPDSIPEIRITFPDEQDEAGKSRSGRVLIVRVGETGIGLEPMREEQLPAYEKAAGSRFQSIDMERIGGLKEKSSWS